jgi:putative transposase
MPAPMTRDLPKRIVRAVEGGSSIRAAAARFAVSPSAAIKLMARLRATGSVAPARYGSYRRPVLAPHETVLRSILAGQPDITLPNCKPSCASDAASRCASRPSMRRCAVLVCGTEKALEGG